MDKNFNFYDDVIAHLRAVKHSDLKQVALKSGVPEGTLRKIYYREVSNPRVQTVQALHNYFASVESFRYESEEKIEASLLPGRMSAIKVR